MAVANTRLYGVFATTAVQLQSVAFATVHGTTSGDKNVPKRESLNPDDIL